MAIQWISGCSEINERIAEGQQLTRLHPHPMHPCQLFLLALCPDPTRIFDVLLGHEISALNDPLRGTARVRLWVDLGSGHPGYPLFRR